MEARGYHGGKGRTSMVELHFRFTDAVALVVSSALSTLIMLL